jgi:ABC-type antimicrobial peptide transport system permease subunit
VVVSESLAAALFPGETPIGRQIRLAARNQPAEVIGVVGDVKHRALDEPVLPTIYLSTWQFPARGSILVLRTTRPESDAIAVVREHVARLDGDLPVYGGASLTGMVARSPGVPARRLLTATYLAFALLALALGGLGLFGVVAHDVAARRTELALRIALGANPTRILNTEIGHSGWMVGSALVVGGVLSFWAAQALGGAVVGTSGGVDLLSAGAAAAVLLLVSVCAVLPAARRAARTDPLVVLRGD